MVSGLLYGLLGYFGVTLIRSGISVYNLNFWRFAVAFILVLAIVVVRRQKRTANIKTIVSTMVNGAFFYSGSGIFFFLAAEYIGTGQAMVIFFIYPIWVMVMNWLFLGQPFRLQYCSAFVLILVGLVFLVDLKELNFDFMGISLSLAASLCYAVYIFWSKRLNVTPLDSAMWVSFGCAMLGLVLAVGDGSFSTLTSLDQWFHLIGFAVICTAVPMVMMLEAIKFLTADKASLLSVLEPVFTVVFGVLLLHEVLYINTVIGMLFTLAGAMLVVAKWPEFLLGRMRSSN